MGNNVGTAVAKKGSAVANYGALPPLGNTPGDQRVTTDTRILWTWDGTRWIPTSGKLPWCHAFTSGTVAVGTSYAAVSFNSGSSSGAHGGSNFTVPAGCTGLYQVTFGARVSPNTANLIGVFYVNNAEVAGTTFTSGGQDWVSSTSLLNLVAGAVLQVRVRVFAGSATLESGASLDVSYLHAT